MKLLAPIRNLSGRQSWTGPVAVSLRTPHSALRASSVAFTILEMMLAIMMFSLVLVAIYTIWIAILKGTQVSQYAAASVQRSRIAMHALEDALVTAQFFVANRDWYSFVADQQSMSLVSRLPASFPGVGTYGDQIVRRVSFYLQSGKDGMDELVMTQSPLLLDLKEGETKPYTIVLAKDVSVFELQYWDMQKRNWVDEWTGHLTNSLPKLVAVTLGMGKVPGSSQPQDVVARIVALPSNAVMPDAQAAFGPGAGLGATNRINTNRMDFNPIRDLRNPAGGPRPPSLDPRNRGFMR